MKVLWTPEAVQDRAAIWESVAQDNPVAAVRLDELFSNAVKRLSEYPMLGKTGVVEGTREVIPHKSYRLVYEVHQDALWVLALVHTSRMWPLVNK